MSAIPSTSISLPNDDFIGENIDLTVGFDNTGASTGYGPFLLFYIDTTGADGDDGLGFNDASYLGEDVTTTEITLDNSGSSTFEVFGVEQTVTTPADFTSGDTLVVIELPFGSFVSDQPRADISVNLTGNINSDRDTPINLQTQGGFVFGNTPTEETDGSDDPIYENIAGDSVDTVNPQLVTLSKNYIGPEDETATGPSYVRQFELVIDIAEGQTISNLDVTDILPDNMQFVDVVSIVDSTGAEINSSRITEVSTPDDGGLTSIGSENITENDVGNDGLPTPGGTLSRRIDSITGSTGDRDLVLTYEFFIPRLDDDSDVIINADTGDDIISTNESQLGDNNGGDSNNIWDPVDTRDSNEEVYIPPTATDPNFPTHDLEDQSIAIQKSVNNISDSENTPGDVLEYTIDFQVSDYFAFQNIDIFDTFSDGQRFDTSFTPKLYVTEHGQNSGTLGTPLDFTAANYIVDETQIGNDTNTATDGSTEVTFEISNELITRSFDDGDGLLIGGGVPDGGFNDGGISLNNNPPLPQGATEGQIVFRTVIQQEYSDTFDSGDASVDIGDRLDNDAIIEGEVLDVDDLSVTGFSEDDDTAAEVFIQEGELYKSIYAINGEIFSGADTDSDLSNGLDGYASGINIAPGDEVTYRLTYELPTTDVEDLTLTDYFPFPIYDAETEIDLSANPFDPTVSIVPPGAGETKYGPLDTFSTRTDASSNTPNLNVSVSNDDSNQLTYAYDDFDDDDNQSSIVDILVTVTATDEPAADGLLYTNQVRQTNNTTLNDDSFKDAIVQVTLDQPDVVDITKGVVAYNNNGTSIPNPDFTAPSGVTFATGGGTTFVGTSDPVSSLDLETNPIDSDLTSISLDAGDLVTFALVVENKGNSRKGAFDVTIKDDLPAGFAIPSGGLNLEVTDGTGATITYTGLDDNDASGDDLFGTGIELDDPGSTAASGSGSTVDTDAGSLDPLDPNSGENLAIITFDLEVDGSTSSSIENTATLDSYANLEGGKDFDGSSDTATVNLEPPDATKSIVATSESHTTDANDVAIGEIVRYRLGVTLPEGNFDNFQITDDLPAGLLYLGNPKLAFVADQNADGIDSSTISGVGLDIPGTTPTSPTFDLTTGVTSAVGGDSNFTSGEDVIFSLGNLTNKDRDDNEEYVVIEFDALVENIIGNQTATGVLPNDFTVSATGITDVTSLEVTLDIVEPVIDNVSKVVNTSTGDADDTFTYTITFSNSGNATAFDLNIADTLPTELDNLGSLTTTIFDDSPTPVDVTSSFAITPTSTSSTNGVADDSDAVDAFSIGIDELPVGYSVQVEFTADVVGDINPETSFDNNATVNYSSLPGDGTTSNPTGSNIPGTSGDADGDRNGTGGVNDYTGTNDTPATVTIDNVDGVKSIVATSESHTSEDGDGSNNANARDFAVGEIVRYRLVTEIPEGEIENLILRDYLPRGLTFLNDETSEVAFVSTSGTGINSTDPTGSTLSLGLGTAPGTSNTGNSPDDVTIFTSLGNNAVGSNDSITLNRDNYTNNGNSGTDVRFKLGTITNSDNDADSEYVVVEFNALVDNTVTSNNDGDEQRNDAGDDRNNSFRVFSGATELDRSNTVRANIVEPIITTTKLVDTAATTSSSPHIADDDDSVPFSVTFTNANGADNTDGFDLILTDNLPAELDLTSIDSIQVNDGVSNQNATVGGTSTITTAILDGDDTDGTKFIDVVIEDVSDLGDDSTDIKLNVDRLPKNASITVTYSANITGNIAPEQLIQNTASIEYTSIPGTNGTTSNPTGSTVPGASGEGYGKRDGSDGEDADPDSNDYLDTSNGFIQVPAVVPVKSIISTSESHTTTTEGASATDEDVAIGEIIRYRLVTEIPESTDTNFEITDLLPDGLLYLQNTANISLVSTSGETNGLTSSLITDSGVYSSNPNITPSVSISAIDDQTDGDTTFSSGEDPTFQLGTLSNLDNDIDAEYVVIEFNALVENIATNQDSVALANSFQVTSDNTATQTSENPIFVDIVEPVISDVAKSVNSSTADGGDTLTYTVTFSNTGTADAFDVNIADTLPNELENLTNIKLNGAATGFTNDSTGTALDITLTNGVAVSESVTITFDADVVGTINPDTTFNNDVTVQYTSLDGTGTDPNDTGSTTPGASGDADGDRNGAGASPNTYTDTNDTPVSVTIDSLAAEKSLVKTSETETTGDDVAIGEIVRYQLAVTIPEGETDGFTITEQLPDGLIYLDNDDTTNIAFIANGTGISSSNTNINNLIDINLTGTAIASPDTDADLNLVSGVIADAGGDGSFSSGEDITFTLGDLTNADSDANDEFVVIEFNALVENVTNNTDGGTNDPLSNQFTVGGTSATPKTSNAVTVDIVEPIISDVAKSVNSSTADGGDTLTYTVTFSNTGTADAFDVNIADILPNELENLTNIKLNGAATGFTNDSTGTTLDITLTNEVAVSESVTITFDADVVGTINPDATFDNDVTVQYTSLDGTGTNPNDTGSTTPGASGDADGDRNGAGASPNTYTDTNDTPVTVTIDSLEPLKTITSTSEVSTSGTDVIIGETVRYRLAVEIPEGESDNFKIADALPEGVTYDGNAKLAFVANDDFAGSGTGIDSSTISGSGLDIEDNAATTPTFDLTTGITSEFGNDATFISGEDVTFDLGDLVNTDSDSDSEFVVIEFDATVDGVGTDGSLDNEFTVTAAVDSSITATSSPVTVDVTLDYGDAPDSGSTTPSQGDYLTTETAGGASHGIRNTTTGNILTIGSAIDADNGTLQNADADADGTDDDGVTLSFLETGAESYTIDVDVLNDTSEPATLVGWIDFNRNGSFESGEGISQPVPANATSQSIELKWDDNNVTLPNLPAMVAGDTYARFRLSTDSDLTTSKSAGILDDGEVEDYKLTIFNTVTGNEYSDPITESNDVPDIITGGEGQDTLTGGTGEDIFVYTKTSDGVDIIEDFEDGTDLIDFSAIIAGELGGIDFSGTNPIDAGYVDIVSFGDHTMIQVDFDNTDTFPKDVLLLDNIASSDISVADFIF